MGYFEAYYAYHKRRGNSTKFYKDLEVAILDLIAQRKFKISQNASDPKIVETKMRMYKIENFNPLMFVKDLGKLKIFSIEGYQHCAIMFACC